LEAIDGEKEKGGKTGLVIFLMAFAHAAFYFALSLYLPLGLDELFLLGYALVLTDSGLVVLFGARLLGRLLRGLLPIPIRHRKITMSLLPFFFLCFSVLGFLGARWLVSTVIEHTASSALALAERGNLGAIAASGWAAEQTPVSLGLIEKPQRAR